jgi:hypothetical protein
MANFPGPVWFPSSSGPDMATPAFLSAGFC